MAANCVIFYKIPQIGCNQQTADVPLGMLTLERDLAKSIYNSVSKVFCVLCTAPHTCDIKVYENFVTKSQIFFIRSKYVRLDWLEFIFQERNAAHVHHQNTHSQTHAPAGTKMLEEIRMCVWGSLMTHIQVSVCRSVLQRKVKRMLMLMDVIGVCLPNDIHLSSIQRIQHIYVGRQMQHNVRFTLHHYIINIYMQCTMCACIYRLIIFNTNAGHECSGIFCEQLLLCINFRW